MASPQSSRKRSILPKYSSGKPYRRDETGMTSISGASADAVFSSMQVNSGSLEYFAGKSLERGLDLYKKKEYSAAVSAFRMSISLDPTAQNAAGAAQYMSNSYLAMGDSESALESLKTFVGQNSTLDTAHANLAQFLFSQDRYEEAVTEYEKTVELNPSEGNRYALGQAYLQTGEYGKAEEQFMQVLRMVPDDPAPHMGLGQTYAGQGRYDIAVKEFKAAIDKKWDFYEAYTELGCTYADMGEIDLAQNIFEFLDEKDPEQADLLSRYIYKADPPKIIMTYSDSTFPHYRPARTAVSDLDSALSTAGASKLFFVKFQFDKEMDRESVEETTNWSIGRAGGYGASQYNYGLAIPSTEISLQRLPDYVSYDSQNLCATVFFKIYQNSTADATIDPGHIEFSFRGTDRFEQKMDPKKDQWTGFSGVF
jgi:tetratricopeptide (TPR) repeat protein